MLKPIGLTHGHFECRFLDETIPVFTDLLAMKVVERTNGETVLQHPNTAWRLVVHEGGPDAPDKPRNNHYGFRVAHTHEIGAAHAYVDANKARYGIKRVTKPHATHFAHSIYLTEPGGNTLEIEYYEPQAVAEGRRIAAPHWTRPLSEHEFPGKGYIPQALTHGTLECDDKEASARFYRDILGLEIVGGGRISVYIKHPATPWYIVVLPARRRRHLTPASRFTVALSGPAEVEAAHRELAVLGPTGGINDLGDLRRHDGQVSFIMSDLDRNWWEIAASVDARS